MTFTLSTDFSHDHMQVLMWPYLLRYSMPYILRQYVPWIRSLLNTVTETHTNACLQRWTCFTANIAAWSTPLIQILPPWVMQRWNRIASSNTLTVRRNGDFIFSVTKVARSYRACTFNLGGGGQSSNCCRLSVLRGRAGAEKYLMTFTWHLHV